MKYIDTTDEKLMQGLQAGDEGAFNALYHRYARKMHGYFWRLLYQNTSLAEDYTQQLFMKIIESKSRFDTSKKFSTWIYTIAGNMVKNEYRSREREAKRRPMAKHWHKDDSLEFLDNLDRELRTGRVQKAIDGLEEKQRQCFVLKHQQGCSIKEISEIMQCPEGTVKSRLHYALKLLSDKLKKLRYS